jgi:DNA-binding NarL/FixJ family response regulator
MDVSLPDGTGVQATKLLKERYPGVAVLALTAYDEDEYVFTILQSGASGYLLKTANATELISAVRAVSTGESVLSPSIARKVVSRAARQPDPEDLVEPLSTRELEVLRLAAEGLTNRQIGARLAMSPRTAQTHLSNVYSKMGVQSRTEAVTRAIERGWLAARGRPRRLE